MDSKKLDELDKFYEYKKELYELNIYLDNINNNINDLITNSILLKELSSDIINKYDVDIILNTIDIRDTIKTFIRENIKTVSIYTNQNYLIIKYIINDQQYKFEINIINSNMLIVYKNNDIYKQYNMYDEFGPLSVISIKTECIIDRYVTLFFKNMDIKFGMILIGYYYFIKHVIDNIDRSEITHMYVHNDIDYLKMLFCL